MIDMCDFAADEGHEILLETGYWISIFANRRDAFKHTGVDQALEFENSLRELDSNQAEAAMSSAGS